MKTTEAKLAELKDFAVSTHLAFEQAVRELEAMHIDWEKLANDRSYVIQYPPEVERLRDILSKTSAQLYNLISNEN